MAEWTAAYINGLPDSSFLYVAPGGKKDSEGKTVPRSLRYFPVKDAAGKPDLPHIRNALARIPQSNVPASAKAAAIKKAQNMLAAAGGGDGRSEEFMPRDDLIRSGSQFELETGDGMPKLHGRAAVYGEWAEIDSRIEGHFFERFQAGSFAKTIQERGPRLRCLFHHGDHPTIGVMPLGPITKLDDTRGGLDYEVQLLDTDYVRALIPGLEAGLYGSSFRFGVVGKDDNQWPRATSRNPDRLPERTITQAYLREFGPTPFPVYDGTSAQIGRSLTDEFVLGRFSPEALLHYALQNPETVERLSNWRLARSDEEPPSEETEAVSITTATAAEAAGIIEDAYDVTVVDESTEPDGAEAEQEGGTGDDEAAPSEEADERSHSARDGRATSEPLYTGKKEVSRWRL